jgi:hypothetical protein
VFLKAVFIGFFDTFQNTLFWKSVDETFEGTHADFIKPRANVMVNSMLNFLSDIPALRM